MRATIALTVRPPGYVKSLQVANCNGGRAFCDSLVAAIKKSEPFPRPRYEELYNEDLRIIFEP
jgi:outer membrane biosynthesis protein TonB